MDIIGGRKCCSQLGSLNHLGCSSSRLRMLVIWSRTSFLPKAVGEGDRKPELSKLLAKDGFLLCDDSASRLAKFRSSFLLGTAPHKLDPIGLSMRELQRELAVDLV